MPSLPRLRDTLIPRHRKKEILGRRTEERHDRFEPRNNPTSGGSDNVLARNDDTKNKNAHSLFDKPNQQLSVSRYVRRPIEVELNDSSGHAEIRDAEKDGIFTEKCSVSFTKPPSTYNDVIPTDLFPCLGELCIVVRLECEYLEPGIHIHRLKNLQVCGFGPTKWAIEVFFKDERVFKTQGVSHRPKGEDIMLGNFQFPFICR